MLIGEVARRSGLSKDTLRHYESLGLIHSSPRRAGSRIYRDYDDTTLERLSLIAFAKMLGSTLRELADPINRALSDESTEGERAALFLDKIREIDARIAHLQQARQELVALARRPNKDYVDGRLKELGLWIE